MGAEEINVAYEGTSADLGLGADMSLFDNGFDWDNLSGSIDNMAAVSGFTAINDGSATGTVSPKDIFAETNSSSVPPSTAFTNLTTPGSALLDTPDESYETSPLFTESFTTDSSAPDTWFSLFPETNDDPTPQAPAMTRTISASSGHVIVHPGGEGRKRSSATHSPMTACTRPSTSAGVRKREKTLPPIIVDENDTVALKRARNTAAARKSRDKKVKERETLEVRIMELESEVEHWKALALARHPQLE